MLTIDYGGQAISSATSMSGGSSAHSGVSIRRAARRYETGERLCLRTSSAQGPQRRARTQNNGGLSTEHALPGARSRGSTSMRGGGRVTGGRNTVPGIRNTGPWERNTVPGTCNTSPQGRNTRPWIRNTAACRRGRGQPDWEAPAFANGRIG
ncbi:hypothetical protein LY13_004611 [Prauserella aidingensis]|nr:hypothetical protein [Prauserella aidingensis]